MLNAAHEIIKPIRKNVLEFPGAVQLCIYCKESIMPGSKYCPWCGKKQDVYTKKKEAYQPKTKAEVFPIKGDEWIEKMQDALLNGAHGGAAEFYNRRNYMMFTVGIDIGVRITDLLNLRVCDFLYENYKPKSQTRIIENKTGKSRDLFFNKNLQEAMVEYIKYEGFHYNDLIFPADKQSPRIMTQRRVIYILQQAAERIGYPLHVGCRTIRKTYGYRTYCEALKESRESGQRALTTLCSIFGHSSELITLRYIGIDEQEKIDLHEKTASDYSLYHGLMESASKGGK
ncbi:MAG: tyrosine-type recombinase/integrase [Firmicutes bacterium]|nr:tyrosine-type recombinase/integrase [Bacillota bacterium]